MWLLVGLGNPGERYRRTRHNLGRDAVVTLAKSLGLPPEGARFKGHVGSGRVGDRRVIWLLPGTYMNLSGESVSEAVRFYKLPLDRVVVFHDDLDLDLARIKIKQGGGNAGHNGLKSMQQLLGSPDFVRVRLGIGKPAAGQDPAAFVLAPFPASERALVDPVLDALPNLLSSILDGDYAGVLNRLAQLRVPVLNSKPLSG